MAVTPVHAAADLERVTMIYDPELDTLQVVYQAQLFKGRKHDPHVVSQIASNPGELVGDTFHNDLVEAINTAAAAYSA